MDIRCMSKNKSKPKPFDSVSFNLPERFKIYVKEAMCICFKKLRSKCEIFLKDELV